MENSFRALLLLTCLGCASAPQDNPWGKVRAAAGAESQPIGFYDRGCLSGGQSLLPDGPGFQVMRPSRMRYYGHPELIAFITGLSLKVPKKVGSLLVGDLSQPRGGPMVSGHSSHQIGLDVDVWFRTSDHRLTLSERENWEAWSAIDEAFTENERLNGNWTEAQETLLRHAAQDARVQRIFVNARIKDHLCKKFPNQEWLRRLRPWWGHDDHFHVRLKCMAETCEQQEEVAEGTGCDDTLAWWLSEEGRAEQRQKDAEPSKPRSLPKLPESCTALQVASD